MRISYKLEQIFVKPNFARYFIHYKGWNKNWDEWVPEARMLKFTDENVEHQKVSLCFSRRNLLLLSIHSS